MAIAITDIIMADTKTITQNRPAPTALLLAGVAVALLLLGLGFPRFVAALQFLDAAPVVRDVGAGKPVQNEAVELALHALDRANGWHTDSKTLSALGTLLSYQAVNASSPARQAELAGQARAAFTSSLAAAPAQAEVWYRLAWLDEWRANRGAAVKALRLSFLSAAIAPELMVPRLELGFRLYAAMDEADAALFKRQIRLTWITAPDKILGLSHNGQIGALVKQALDEVSEDEMQAFIRARTPKQ